MGFGNDALEIDAFLGTHKAKRGISPYIPKKPTPKQQEFLAVDGIEAMFGGAAAGGKSEALLIGALLDVDKPGYNALLLRRTFRDLNQPEAIMHRAIGWLRGTDAVWNAQDKRFTFPRSGATLTFGYLDNERDLDQYQSAEYQYIGFDELTHFPERWYLYLFSRLRKKTGVDIKLRMRAATNPGGIGHAWVKARFVVEATRKAVFIPAKLADNPHADAESYRESLSKLDKVTRSQLEDGCWDVDASRLVYSFNSTDNCIDISPVCTYRILSQDYGVSNDTSWTIIGWNAHDPRTYILKSWKKKGITPGENAEIVTKLQEDHRFERMIGDAGGLGKGYTEEAKRRWKLPIENADKNNKRGFIALMNGAFERKEIMVVRRDCEELIDEYVSLPWADEERLKEAPGYPNHCADGALYGWRSGRAYMTVSGGDNVRVLKSKLSSWGGNKV